MWLSIIIPVLLTILVIVCIFLTLVVLMQRPKNEGLGAAFGSGMTENIFGAQTTTVLTKATVYLGGIFFLVTLLLTVLTAKQSSDRRVGILENEARKAAAVTPTASAATSPPASPAPSDPSSPASSAVSSPAPSAATPAASPAASPAPTAATPAPPSESPAPKPESTPASPQTEKSVAAPSASPKS